MKTSELLNLFISDNLDYGYVFNYCILSFDLDSTIIGPISNGYCKIHKHRADIKIYKYKRK